MNRMEVVVMHVFEVLVSVAHVAPRLRFRPPYTVQTSAPP